MVTIEFGILTVDEFDHGSALYVWKKHKSGATINEDLIFLNRVPSELLVHVFVGDLIRHTIRCHKINALERYEPHSTFWIDETAVVDLLEVRVSILAQIKATKTYFRIFILPIDINTEHFLVNSSVVFHLLDQ